MYYFIPSWYRKDGSLNCSDLPWYAKQQNSDFDDTISQLHIFASQNEDVTLLMLGYSPQLRYTLHREDLLDIPYVSLFDQAQGIKARKVGLFTYRDLNWPSDVEWVFTPFVILAKRNGKLYASIDFGKEGFMLSATFYKEDVKTRLVIFDDRGFISSVTFYNEGVEEYTNFYNERADWVMRMVNVNGTVYINPDYKKDFQKKMYRSLDELIGEKFTNFMESHSSDDVIIMAGDEHHNHIVLNAPIKQKVIMSIYGTRMNIPDHIEELKKPHALIVDRQEGIDILQNQFHLKNVYNISPFDTRFELGQSQRTHLLKIYYPIEKMINKQHIITILQYMETNPNVQLYLGLYSFQHEIETQVKDDLHECLEAANIEDFVLEGDNVNGEIEIPKEERVFIRKIMTENDLLRELKDIRLIVDLREHPDVFTMIAGMSSGIPQIVRDENDYVKHKKNGLVLSDLEQDIKYYLEDLDHWNASLVYCYSMIQENTGEEILNKWKEIINHE